MNDDIKYPISEIFNSPQGEGVYTGVMMTFIRLAGCTVGKPYPKAMYSKHVNSKSTQRDLVMDEALPIYTEKCTLYDGREFPCDTDYRVKFRMTAWEIAAKIPDNIDRVCITGGEPCMHNIMDLIPQLTNNGKRQIHIETSGTINWCLKPTWITVSPKKGVTTFMLDTCDELKLLVDEKFNPEELIPDSLVLPLTIAKQKPTYLHPVNYEKSINETNVRLCLKWQDKYPQFRVGLQLHKALSIFTEQEVR